MGGLKVRCKVDIVVYQAVLDYFPWRTIPCFNLCRAVHLAKVLFSEKEMKWTHVQRYRSIKCK